MENTSVKCKCLRWAFRCANWNPSRDEWLRAVESIQVEEVSRINKFHFREDAKSALIGRLMLRRSIIERFPTITWADLRLTRSDRGKPILSIDSKTIDNFDFNISHQGDYVVLAACSARFCGADVMRIKPPRPSQSVEEYLNLFRRQFSKDEFSRFDELDEDSAKLKLFYRYWCLKESLVKALGVGIHSDLSLLDFMIKTPRLRTDHVTTDTTVNFHQSHTTSWKFEESLLDADHVTSVCYDTETATDCRYHSNTGLLFVEKNIDFLLESSQPLHSVCPDEFETFQKKSIKI